MAHLGDTKAVSLTLLDGVIGNLNPKTTLIYDLGTNDLKWNNIYGNLKGTADAATKATLDGNGNVITSTYLPLAGGTMTGNITLTSAAAAYNSNLIKYSSGGMIGGDTAGGIGIYANKIYLRPGNANGSSGLGIILDSGTLVNPYENNKVNLGTSSLKYATIYATTFDGNATTATALATTRKIDGINFDGSADVLHYGACSTAVGTAAKTVAITGFTLTTGAVFYVKFTNGNTANDPTLNVNNTGAKNIYFLNGTRLQTTSNYPDYLLANKIYLFMYDGTNYVLINNPNVLELYEKRTSTTSLNKAAIYGGAGAMFHIIAHSSTTTGKTPTDANIFLMNWDNNGGYDGQLGISTTNSRLYVRSRISEGTAWREAATIVAATKTGNTDTPVYVNETGEVVAITGTLANSITGNAATATQVNNNLVLKFNTGTTEGTNLYTFNGSAGKTINIKTEGITATAAAGEVTISGTTVTFRDWTVSN